MAKFTFEVLIDVTEQTTVEADSVEEAQEMVYQGDCDWKETNSQGGDIYFLIEEKGEIND